MTDDSRTAEDPLATAAATLDRAGYDVAYRKRRRRPAAVAEPTPGAPTPVADRRGDGEAPRAVALEPVEADTDPAAVVDAVAHALREDRLALFVPVGPDRAAARDRPTDVMTDPPAARRERPDGTRELYHLPDRVRLDGGGLALHEPGGPVTATVPDPRWREARPDGEGRDGDRADPNAAPVPGGEGDRSEGDRTGTDRRRLVFEDGDRTVAVLDSADELACPGPDTGAFPLSYRRTDEKRFAVHDREGRLVGTFAGVRAMRRSGFRPVPEPLVPEFALPASPTDAWATFDPGAGRLHTATGDRPLAEAGLAVEGVDSDAVTGWE